MTRKATSLSAEEVDRPPQPSFDQPIMPLVPRQPEVAVSLYGDPNAGRDTARRRKVDALLEAHGVRPRGTW